MRPREIKIFVDGGFIVAVHGLPKGYKPIVVDYDIDGIDEEDLTKDDGEECFKYPVREYLEREEK